MPIISVFAKNKDFFQNCSSIVVPTRNVENFPEKFAIIQFEEDSKARRIDFIR